MKTTSLLWIAMLTVALVRPAPAADIALVGTEYATKHFRTHIIDPIQKKVFTSSFNEFPVEEYKKYKTVILLEFQSSKERKSTDRSPTGCWDHGQNADRVREFLKQGNRILLVGVTAPKIDRPRDLSSFEDILGYTKYLKTNLLNPARISESVSDSPFEGFPSGALQLVSKELNMTVGNVTRAETLALAPGPEGLDYPLVTRNRVGQGVVYWFGSSPFRLGTTPDVDEKSLQAYLNLFQKILNE